MESAQTEPRKTRGRKNPDRQEAITQPGVVKDRIDELVKLYTSAGEAQELFNDAVKTCAEKSGYNASAVRKFVLARAGEKYEEAKRLAEQQLELFSEVGEA